MAFDYALTLLNMLMTLITSRFHVLIPRMRQRQFIPRMRQRQFKCPSCHTTFRSRLPKCPCCPLNTRRASFCSIKKK